jgi:hypothetical protein
MKSPEFIVPENETYNKQSSIDELNQSFEKLKGNANKANLNDLVEDLPFGPTERHLHQLRKICEALSCSCCFTIYYLIAAVWSATKG